MVNCSFCSAGLEGADVVCAKCSAHFHATTQCTGLSTTAIRCVLEEGSSGLQYICTSCRCTGVVSPEGSESSRGVAQMFTMLHSLAGTVTQLAAKVDSLVGNMRGEVGGNGPDLSRESIHDEIREYEERKKK